MTPSVYIVDDNEEQCRSLQYHFESVQIPTETYPSPWDFLATYQETPGCLLLDIRMPQMTGLALQEVLLRKKITLPIIFMTGYADVPIAIRAMKKGAFDFFTKPLNHQILLESIHRAMDYDQQQHTIQKRYEAFKQLTEQENKILNQIVSNLSTVKIAAALHLSPKTIEYHRAKIMQKLHVNSVVRLTKLYCLYQQSIGAQESLIDF